MKMVYEAHEQRVIDERAALDDNIDKLNSFLNGSRFQNVNPDEQDRLRAQLKVMREYSGILTQRIEAFGLPPAPPATSGTVELDALDKDKSNW